MLLKSLLATAICMQLNSQLHATTRRKTGSACALGAPRIKVCVLSEVISLCAAVLEGHRRGAAALWARGGLLPGCCCVGLLYTLVRYGAYRCACVALVGTARLVHVRTVLQQLTSHCRSVFRSVSWYAFQQSRLRVRGCRHARRQSTRYSRRASATSSTWCCKRRGRKRRPGSRIGRVVLPCFLCLVAGCAVL